MPGIFWEAGVPEMSQPGALPSGCTGIWVADEETQAYTVLLTSWEVMRVRLRAVQGVLRTKGESPALYEGREGSQEQSEGQCPGAFGQLWIPALLLSTCVTGGKLPNLSVPLFLIGKMGVILYLHSQVVGRIKWVTIHITLGTGPGVEGTCCPRVDYYARS